MIYGTILQEGLLGRESGSAIVKAYDKAAFNKNNWNNLLDMIKQYNTVLISEKEFGSIKKYYNESQPMIKKYYQAYDLIIKEVDPSKRLYDENEKYCYKTVDENRDKKDFAEIAKKKKRIDLISAMEIKRLQKAEKISGGKLIEIPMSEFLKYIPTTKDFELYYKIVHYTDNIHITTDFDDWWEGYKTTLETYRKYYNTEKGIFFIDKELTDLKCPLTYHTFAILSPISDTWGDIEFGLHYYFKSYTSFIKSVKLKK